MPHISISQLDQYRFNNGLSPIQCQAIIYTNAELLSIGPLGINFLIKIQVFIHENASENIVCNIGWPFCLGGEELAWPRDALWWHRSGSTLSQAMAWHCQLSSKVFCGINIWAIPRVLMNLIHNLSSEITLLKLLPHPPRANEFNGSLQTDASGHHNITVNQSDVLCWWYHVFLWAVLKNVTWSLKTNSQPDND